MRFRFFLIKKEPLIRYRHDMIQIGSGAYVGDNTGVRFVKIFQVIGKRSKREANIGDGVLVVVRCVSRKKKFVSNEKWKLKYRYGSVHRAVLVHMRANFKRHNGTYLWFRRNVVVLVDKYMIPQGTRIKSSIPKEVTKVYPQIGAIASKIV